MYFWSGITALAVLGVWGFPAKAQIGENKDVEDILTAAVQIQQHFYEKFELDGFSTTNCLINGIKSRNIDILQLKRLADSVKKKTDLKCNTLAHEWKYDFQDFFEPDNGQLQSEGTQILSTTCGKYPSAVWNAVQNGQTQLSKKIILGLLATVQPNITTPDAITLLENSAKIIENLQIDAFYVQQNQDVLLEISEQVMTQNHLQPNQNYQLTEMAAAQTSIQYITNFNILSIIRVNTFPEDVINARDAVAKGIDDGQLDVCFEGGWSTPPDQLLGLVTSLTAVSNDHPLTASIHVLYPHVRMWYFCLYGYQYVPRTFNDIVFLLNSFITIRNPTLLREVYLEFSKTPWQEYAKNLDFKQYCDPRSLLTDIVKSILDHPDSLKTCNTILFNYFINADEDCPHWLKPMFPTNSTGHLPLEVILPRRERLHTTTTETPTVLECEEGETKIVEPESLIAIFDSEKHPVIAEILRENTYPVSYNSREAVFKHIIGDLITTRTDYPKVKQQAMRFAQQGLVLNEKRILPVEFRCVCSMDDQVVCEDGENKVINPESLIEIFNSLNYPLLAQFLRDHPFTSDARNRHSALHVVLRKFMHDAHISEELRTIFKLFLEPNPPVNEKGRLAVTWTCVPKCNPVSVIDQESLIGIVNEGRITPIKNVVFWEPVFFNDYRGLETREAILKKVLSDRRLKINDDVMRMVLAQAIVRMKISWQGMLPPIIDELCEHELKYNITFEPMVDETPKTCDNVTVINQKSLIQIIGEDRINVLKNLIFMEPILFSDYGQLHSREEILKSVLYDRMVKVDDEILNLVIPQALYRLQITWRGMLPPITEEICKTDLIYNIITPIPPIDDDVVCDEDSVPEAPNCGLNQDATLIADTSSLFAALDKTAPRATVIRQKIRDSIYEIDNSRVNLKSYVLRDILLNLREEIENQRLAYEVDQLLVSIHYGDSGLTPVVTKYICLDKKHECGAGEVLVEAIDVTTLWDAVEDEAPIPLHIIESVETYLVPAKKSKSYQKSVVLREILDDLLEDTDDLGSRERIVELMGAIRSDGPGLQDAAHVLQCFPDTANIEAPCDNDDEETKTRGNRETDEDFCDEMNEASSEVKSTALPLEIQNQELSEECEEEITTTTERVTTSSVIIESSEECEDSGEVPTPQSLIEDTPHHTTTANLMESWENIEYSDEVNTPETLINDTPYRTTTTTESHVESLEECDDSEEVTTPQPLIEDTPDPTTTEAIMESPEECDELDEVPMRTPAPTVESVTESSLECEDSVENTPTTEEVVTEECDESEEIVITTEATTTEATTTPGLPDFGEPCKIDQWPLLLKVNLEETCFDETSMSTTHPVDMVSVGELLTNAEGTDDDKYIISAKLGGLDTYQHIQSFDWEAYCTRREFFNALMQHIGFETAIIQQSNEPVTIRTLCRKSLADVVPKTHKYRNTIYCD